MKIAVLSKAGRSGGGASRVAEELCRLLQANGHTAHHYVGLTHLPQPSFQKNLYANKLLGKVTRRLNLYIKRVGFPELVPWEYFFLSFQGIANYDLLHFHDLSSMISPLTVRYLARKIPTAWTFHDCSPFTGGCLYPLECQNFKTRCEQCPQLGLWPIDSSFDFTGYMQGIKRKTVRENNFVAVAPSTWMAEMAISSGMFVNPPVVVPNGVDTSFFKPLNKQAVRKTLNLPADKPVILLLAAYIGEERKGIKYALKALSKIKQLNPCLLLVGTMDENSRNALAEFDSVETGYLTDDQFKAEYFAAADLFLFTSLADNMPLVVLETMSTATPTVGFATGGVPEMVEHNKSGYLVPKKDVDGLIKGMLLGVQEKRAGFWGKNARQRVEQRYSYCGFLQQHINLYETVIENFNHE